MTSDDFKEFNEYFLKKKDIDVYFKDDNKRTFNQFNLNLSGYLQPINLIRVGKKNIFEDFINRYDYDFCK